MAGPAGKARVRTVHLPHPPPTAPLDNVLTGGLRESGRTASSRRPPPEAYSRGQSCALGRTGTTDPRSQPGPPTGSYGESGQPGAGVDHLQDDPYSIQPPVSVWGGHASPPGANPRCHHTHRGSEGRDVLVSWQGRTTFFFFFLSAGMLSRTCHAMPRSI